ncbi:hypothetical protein NYZ42_16915 [Acinetobacter baumannii]|nr:hypothetical protein [Acinetobacter baumannii]
MDNHQKDSIITFTEESLQNIYEVSLEIKNIFNNQVNIIQNGSRGINSFIPEDFNYKTYGFNPFYQEDNNIKSLIENYIMFTNRTNNLFKEKIDKNFLLYKNISFQKALKNQENKIKSTKEIFKYLFKFSEEFKNKINNQIKDYSLLNKNTIKDIEIVDELLEISKLKQEVLDNLKETFNELKSLSYDIEITHDSIEILINNEKEIYLTQILRFKEETDLLLKQYKNEVSSLTEKYDNQFKNYNLDIEKSNDTIEIAKQNIEDLQEKNLEIHKNLSSYERRLQQISDSRAEDIQHVLEDKLNELETMTQNKITVIDQSYQNAQTNYTKFKELVEKAGVYNLIVNYKDKAEEEKKEYKTYRKYTSRALYGAIGFTIFILAIPLLEHWFSSQPTNIDYYSILVRLTISLMFLVLALFFSKQAGKHYECYQENNRTFLQLAALEPFMANMSHEDQLAIRKQLVPTYFNQNADGKFASKGDEVDISTNMHNLLSQVISVVAEKKDSKSSTNSSESNIAAK